MKIKNEQEIAQRMIGGLSVTLVRNQSRLAEDWQQFEQTAVGTLYQTHAWCSAWSETIGVRIGVKSLVIVGRNSANEIQFLLPLQIRKRLGVAMLEWQTHPLGNYGFGLFAPDFYAKSADWFALFANNLWAMIPDIQLLHLAEMPAEWAGKANPFVSQFNIRGPNDSFLITLQNDYEALFASRRSKDTQSKTRRRDRKLADLGTLEFMLPETLQQSHEIMDVLFRQLKARLAERGVYSTASANEHSFIHLLISQQTIHSPKFLPFSLNLNGQPLCVVFCANIRGIYYAIMTSLAAGDARKFAPGDFALRKVIAKACSEKQTLLDLSSGTWDYKMPWADIVLPLHANVRTLGWRGIPAALYLLCYYKMKRIVKSSSTLRSFAYAIRALR